MTKPKVSETWSVETCYGICEPNGKFFYGDIAACRKAYRDHGFGDCIHILRSPGTKSMYDAESWIGVILWRTKPSVEAVEQWLQMLRATMPKRIDQPSLLC